MVDFIEKQEIYRLSNENTQKEQQQKQTKEAKKNISETIAYVMKCNLV